MYDFALITAPCSFKINLPSGPLITVPLSRHVGRRWLIMGSNVPLLLGWLLAGVARDLPTLYAARVAWGAATGMQFATVPIYIGEIAEVTI